MKSAPTRRFDCDWVDAFTDRPFGGNGCAIVYDSSLLDSETCIAFTRETSLVECVFLEPSSIATMKVRYFLASGEIPFAGHPTIATVTSLYHRGFIGEGPLTLETQAGLIPVKVELREGLPWVSMTQNAPLFGENIDPKLIAHIGGIEPSHIVGLPQLVSTGLPFCIVLLRDLASLNAVQLNLDAMSALPKINEHALAEPFWATCNGFTARGDTAARLLLAPPQPPADPFTGSATGALAAYLWHHGHIKHPHFIAEQGHDLERPGYAEVNLLGPPDHIHGVRVSGSGYLLMSGQLHLPLN